MTQNIKTAADVSPHNIKQKTITKHKIGKITYIVESSSSDTATDTIDRKIEKLIMRDCARVLK